jgi:uncharacterized protein
LALGWFFKSPPFAQLRWSLIDGAYGLAASVPMLLMFFACIRWPIGPLARIKSVADELIRPLFSGASLIDLAVLSFAAGFFEEMLFRGVVQPALAHSMGIVGGVAVASVLFGLLHPMTVTYTVLAALLGAYLGWLMIATQNLLTPIVAHAVYDWIALIVLLQGKPSTGAPEEQVPADEESPIPPMP